MKKCSKSQILGLIIVLFTFNFIYCASSTTQNSTTTQSSTTTSLPSFLELALGDNINYSLFTMNKKGKYQMKTPRMVNVFGRQPAGVVVELDTSNKISVIYYYYGINGDFFSRNDIDKAISFFNIKAAEMGLEIDVDIDSNSDEKQSIIKLGKNNQGIGMMMVAQSNEVGNFECTIVLFNDFSKIIL